MPTFQYAKAFCELNEKDNILNFIELVDCFDDELIAFMCSPAIKQTSKKELIDNLNTKVNKKILNFLHIILLNKRFKQIRDISTQVKKIYNIKNNIMEIEVISKEKLDSKNIVLIKKGLESKYKRDVELIEKTDDKIISGIKLLYNNKLIDNTINYKLDFINKLLK